jgi:DNA-binding HxlR family transcriptional regulator
MMFDMPLYPCPVEATVSAISGKWKPLLLFYLLGRTRRFGELHRLMPQVSLQMLTSHLRELERDGIVHRQNYKQVPPKVEYSLTPLGNSLQPILLLMVDWGQQYFRQEQHGPTSSAK